MQIAKQLFNVGELFDLVEDLNVVRRAIQPEAFHYWYQAALSPAPTL